MCLATNRETHVYPALVCKEHCFNDGRAAACSRFHSPTETSTAASLPRLVTICGPSTRQVSKNSLNRAFAS